MERDFVERRDESFYLVGSRVPLAGIVRESRTGSPQKRSVPRFQR